MAVINGRQYEFADLTLILGGRDVIGFRGIRYAEKQEKELHYGKGNKPRSIQRGNLSYEGEITVSQDEYESLVALGGGRVTSLHLNAVCAYGNPSKGDALITDVITGIEFTEGAK